MLREHSEEPSIIRKDFFTVFILLFNVYAWFYMTHTMIGVLLNDINVTYTQDFIIWTVYYMAIIGSSIVGSIISNKIRRLTFLYSWMILGAITSLSPLLFGNLTSTHVLIISVLLGVSFGLGMPSCLAYFADHTFVENRGRIGGIILLITNLSAPLFALFLGMLNLAIMSIIFAMWRASGLITFFLKPEKEIISETKKMVSFTSVLKDKSFIFYFIAWLMFCLVDRFEQPILKNFFGDFHFFIVMIGPIIGSFSAFAAGLLSDRIGRKRVVLYAFVTLGLAYAIIGLAPAILFSWYFYLAADSVSTGMLMVTFYLILWGDLSKSNIREKYYAIGGIPYFLTYIIRPLSTLNVTVIPETSAFSLASFFLFLAVLPLLYAPETLPEKKIRLRRLRGYMEAAKKVKEKYVKNAES